MDRRKFVSVGAASLTILPFLGFASILNNNETPVKPKWLLDLIKMNDEGIKIPAAKKITDPNDHFYGAYVNGFNIPNDFVRFAKKMVEPDFLADNFLLDFNKFSILLSGFKPSIFLKFASESAKITL